MTHPFKIASKFCYSPKVAARESGLTIAECRAIRDKRSARLAARSRDRDPLLDAKILREYKRFSYRFGQVLIDIARVAQRQRERDLDAASTAKKAGIRDSLLAMARIARAKGLRVTKSTSRDKRVSSYYVILESGQKLRVSDHHLPATEKRDFMARAHGRDYFDGYHGPEIVIEQPRSNTWLHRKLVLACAGRI